MTALNEELGFTSQIRLTGSNDLKLLEDISMQLKVFSSIV